MMARRSPSSIVTTTNRRCRRSSCSRVVPRALPRSTACCRMTLLRVAPTKILRATSPSFAHIRYRYRKIWLRSVFRMECPVSSAVAGHLRGALQWLPWWGRLRVVTWGRIRRRCWRAGDVDDTVLALFVVHEAVAAIFTEAERRSFMSTPIVKSPRCPWAFPGTWYGLAFTSTRLQRAILRGSPLLESSPLPRAPPFCTRRGKR